MDPVLIAGYLSLFVAVGAIFLAVNLIVGWLVRPQVPNTEKLEVYECGEPTIGSSFVQFDLRFYVVALLFIIFDVEVAVFFPWATVFGKAVQLTDPGLDVVVAEASLDPQADLSASEVAGSVAAAEGPASVAPAAGALVALPRSTAGLALTPAAAGLLRELGFADPKPPVFLVPESTAKRLDATLAGLPAREGRWSVERFGSLLARTAMADMAVFFAVLLVGFAYVWFRGDLDWVRAVSAARASPTGLPREPVRVEGSTGSSVLSA